MPVSPETTTFPQIPIVSLMDPFPDVPAPRLNPFNIYRQHSDGICYVNSGKFWKIRRGNETWIAVYQVYIGKEHITIWPGSWITEQRWQECRSFGMPDLPIKRKEV